VAYCSLDNDDAPCGDGLECLPVLTIDGLGLCGESCPGFNATDECGEGKGCFPVSADQGYCDEVGTAATGEACDEDTACAQFNICTRLNEDDPSECFAFCNRTEGLGDESCQDGEICLELNDVLGACFEGCTPFTEESGCDVAGQLNCLPIESDTRGICIDSGDVALGEECDLVDGSVLGECAAGLACNPDFDSVAPGEEAETGTCSNICRTFSENSGCAEGEVCSIFGTEWGVCEDLEIPAPLEAGDDCPESGQWCSDNTICIQVDQQGNNLCIPLCRFANGDDDCPNGTACEEVLASDALGLCVGG
jgi:hypothetical protein